MNKLILIIAGVLLATTIYAQGSIFIHAYAGAGTTGVTNNNLGTTLNYQNTTASTIGVQIGKKMGMVQLSVGGALLETGYKLNGLLFQNQFDPQTGATNATPQDLVATHRQILIPIKAGLTFKKEKISFIPQVGLAAAIPIGYTNKFISSTTGDEISQVSGKSNTYSIIAIASADIAYHISERIAATLGPSFNYTLVNFPKGPLPAYAFAGNLGVILSL